MSAVRNNWVVRVTAQLMDSMRRARCMPSFAFKNDELPFARRVERYKTNLWLYRTNQRRLCGDFVAVDMSEPRRRRRRVWVLELKRGARLRLGGGGAGNQLVNAAKAVAAVARTDGNIVPDAQHELVSGDGAAVLALLGAA